MVDFVYVVCPECKDRFMVHHEFFRVAGAYCHCPYCAAEFSPDEGLGPQETRPATSPGLRAM